MKTPALVTFFAISNAFAAEHTTSPTTAFNHDSGTFHTCLGGQLATLVIEKGQFTANLPDRTSVAVRTSPDLSIAQLSSAAARYSQDTGNPAILTARIAGAPFDETSHIGLTDSLVVALAPGVDPSAFTRQSGAVSGTRYFFAPDLLVLTYRGVADAINAAVSLAGDSAVMSVEPLCCRKLHRKFIPNDRMFSWATAPAVEYTPRIRIWENAIEWREPASTTSRAYQWNLRNTGQNQPTPLTMIPNNRPAISGDLLAEDNRCDLRVDRAWDLPGRTTTQNVRGAQVKVVIVDDGLDKAHPDWSGFGPAAMEPNANHANFIDPGWNPLDANDPYPPATPPQMRLFDTHGTSSAGIIAARGNNTQRDISGIAPSASLMGIRIITSGFINPLDLSRAIAWKATVTEPVPQPDGTLQIANPVGPLIGDISNNAWGPPATGGSNIFALDPLVENTIDWVGRRLASTDRTILVFPAGNEGDGRGNTNYQGTTNRWSTITVGAVSDIGRRVAYSNPGASITCVAPSNGDELPPILLWNSTPPGWPAGKPIRKNPPIEPWDVPITIPNVFPRRTTQSIVSIATENRVIRDFNGTSAAAAQVSGVIALMLEVNPRLMLRDVKEILMRSCRMVNDIRQNINGELIPSQWRMAPMGKPFHHVYGAGLVDAEKAVRIAAKWQVLPPMLTRELTLGSSAIIPDNNPQGATINIPAPSGIRVEHVEITVKWQHGRRGDLGMVLTVPPNRASTVPMESELMLPRREDYQADSATWADPANKLTTGHRFCSVRHWGFTRTSGATNQPWRLRIWDGTNQGTNTNPTIADPVFVPIGNPSPTGNPPQPQLVRQVKVKFYGCAPTRIERNEPPQLPLQDFAVIQSTNAVNTTVIATGSVVNFPVIAYDFVNPALNVPIQPTILPIAPNRTVTTPAPNVLNPAQTLLVTLDRATGQLSFTPAQVGTYTVNIMAENDLGYSEPRTIQISVFPPLPTYATWQAQQFTPQQLADPSISGPNADPDLDGLVNLLEYTMGLRPLIAEDPPVPEPTVDGDRISFLYSINLIASDFAVRPQIGDGESPWINVTDTTPGVTLEIIGSIGSTRLMRLTMPMDAQKRFFRLRAAPI